VVNWSYILKYLLSSSSRLRKQLNYEKMIQQQSHQSRSQSFNRASNSSPYIDREALDLITRRPQPYNSQGQSTTSQSALKIHSRLQNTTKSIQSDNSSIRMNYPNHPNISRSWNGENKIPTASTRGVRSSLTNISNRGYEDDDDEYDQLGMQHSTPRSSYQPARGFNQMPLLEIELEKFTSLSVDGSDITAVSTEKKHFSTSNLQPIQQLEPSRNVSSHRKANSNISQSLSSHATATSNSFLPDQLTRRNGQNQPSQSYNRNSNVIKVNSSIDPDLRNVALPSVFAKEVVHSLGLGSDAKQAEAAMSIIDKVSQITDKQLSQLDPETRSQILAIRRDLKIDDMLTPLSKMFSIRWKMTYYPVSFIEVDGAKRASSAPPMRGGTPAMVTGVPGLHPSQRRERPTIYRPDNNTNPQHRIPAEIISENSNNRKARTEPIMFPASYSVEDVEYGDDDDLYSQLDDCG